MALAPHNTYRPDVDTAVKSYAGAKYPCDLIEPDQIQGIDTPGGLFDSTLGDTLIGGNCGEAHAALHGTRHVACGPKKARKRN